jgi:hypothetical protein
MRVNSRVLARTLLVVCGAILTACTHLPDSPSSTRDEAAPEVLLRTRIDSVYAAAKAENPIDQSHGVTIGILDSAQTPTSVLVSFENDQEWVIHQFERRLEGWRRGPVLSSGTFDFGLAPGGRVYAMGYSGIIAYIRYFSSVVDQWAVTNVKVPGVYTRAQSYGATINDALFFPDSVFDSDTSYAVKGPIEWQASRDAAPFCNLIQWNRYNTNWWSYTACLRNDNGQFDNSILPQRFALQYHLIVTAYPPLTLSLSDWEANDSEYRMFGVFVTSNSPAVQSYSWEYSTNGTTWLPLAQNPCFTNKYRGAYRADPPQTPSVYLRATVTLVNGQTETQNANWFPAPINISDRICS